MSTRLDYSSPELKQALESPETLHKWEKETFKKYQSASSNQMDDLLLGAELALRLQDAEAALRCLNKALKINPKEADAYYLKAQLAFVQGQTDQALAITEQGLKLVSPQGIESGQLASLQAQVHLKKDDLKKATKSLKTAYKWAGLPSFVHCKTQDTLSVEAFEFDVEIFNALYAWDKSPVETRFCALEADSNGHLFILENRNKWLFKLNAQGELEQGFNQRQLAKSELVMPEEVMSMNDLALSNSKLYITGAQDKIHAFAPDFSSLAPCPAPASDRTLKPISVTLDNEGNLYVIYIHLPGIHMFNSEGFHLGSFGGDIGFQGKNYYCGLAAGADTLYLYDRTELHFFDLKTQKHTRSVEIEEITDVLDVENYPFCWNGVSVNSDHTLDIACTHENQVKSLSADGKCTQTLKGLNQPMDVTRDPAGTLVVADTGSGQILKYIDNKWVSILSHSSFVGINQNEV